MQSAALEGGFSTPSTDAAMAFRSVMNAMARPGRIETLAGACPPAPLSIAAGAVLLTLCDGETPVYLAGDADTPEVRAWIAFHTGAPLTGPETCVFAVGSWQALLPLARFPMGTADYPDRSATLIIEVAHLEAEGTALTGPGIRDTAALSLPDTEPFRANRALFPRGLDFILTCGARVAALPRSTIVAQEGGR